MAEKTQRQERKGQGFRGRRDARLSLIWTQRQAAALFLLWLACPGAHASGTCPATKGWAFWLSPPASTPGWRLALPVSQIAPPSRLPVEQI